jgi:hypothetical protein
MESRGAEGAAAPPEKSNIFHKSSALVTIAVVRGNYRTKMQRGERTFFFIINVANKTDREA